MPGNSTRQDFGPSFSASGSMVAFVSTRSGESEIWTCDPSGGSLRQLTDLPGIQVTPPHWSPDDLAIAFTGIGEACAAVYVMDLESLRPRRLDPHHGHESFCSWSPDAQWIYYNASSDAGWQIWKMRPDGSQRQALTTGGLSGIYATRDGVHLFCLRQEYRGIWRLPASGGEPEQIVTGEIANSWLELTPVDDGFFFTRPGAEQSVLGFYDFTAEAAESLAAIPRGAANLALSPDRSQVLFDRFTRLERDLILVEDFH
jgi:Tol biopolymer transport system component